MTNEYLTSNLQNTGFSALASTTAENAGSELMRASLQNTHSYYRSKIFTVTIGVNPLVTAAAILLNLVSRLRVAENYPDINELYQHLVHEIKAFENTAQKQGYRSETILVARYVLCATFDEIILHTTWGAISDWHMHRLLATFQKDSLGSERFFLILERLSEDPAHHIDLLELMYLCLSLGFQGKYRSQERGDLLLTEIMENLYQRIHLERGEFNKELCEPFQAIEPPKKSPITSQIPIWLVTILVVTLLMTIYIGFNYLLGVTTAPLLQEINTLQQETMHELVQTH